MRNLCRRILGINSEKSSFIFDYDRYLIEVKKKTVLPQWAILNFIYGDAYKNNFALRALLLQWPASHGVEQMASFTG